MKDDPQPEINLSYPIGQLGQALVTATSHEDPRTRRRALVRAQRWQSVLAGMSDGSITIGSRTPLADMPAWVTPSVVRGGFATGTPAAGGSLSSGEVERASHLRIQADRRALFVSYLTDSGLQELTDLLESGEYSLTVPEEAGLPMVAWLAKRGDRVRALALLDEFEPFADQLRFAPARIAGGRRDVANVYRESVGTAAETLRMRKPNRQIETMNEALVVWNPFADELLSFWLAAIGEHGVMGAVPDSARSRAKTLMARYADLSERHTLCTKHRNQKENLGVLVAATQYAVDREQLPARTAGLLKHVLASMVRNRGVPGSPTHEEVRGKQADIAALPTHHQLAAVVVSRLSRLPLQGGTSDIAPLIAPVSSVESQLHGLEAGTAIPPSIEKVIRRTLAGPIETLIDEGVVPSAEVLATLVPQIAAATTASAYPDESLQHLMALSYLAFRRRRSLLLVNLESQVRFSELPWVAAVEVYRDGHEIASTAPYAALVRLGELAVSGFPSTILPNPLVRELDALAQEASLNLPFVEELAADIFMGRFSPKFLRATQIAGELLTGTLYERYYGINYRAIQVLKSPTRKRRLFARPRFGFDELCKSRAKDLPETRSVAANGLVIEQAQILTTHNLATLFGPIGLHTTMRSAIEQLAIRCADDVKELIGRLQNNPRPLRTVKDAAYAWRQMLFFISLADTTNGSDLASRIIHRLQEASEQVSVRLAPAVEGLERAAAGETFLEDGSIGSARRFTGWAVGGHWMVSGEPAL